ncbi:hypothetical protein BDW59DRAFT_179422 [Aspergillus cavernicola]|uniref:Zn(2)-C6 fungal-type domain-containing protein n=1 Tax=Aspergillus cavernicola TaxID=176166 RepID=A0ABR4J3Q7_9EURO
MMQMEYTPDSPGFLIPPPSFRYSPLALSGDDLLLTGTTTTPSAHIISKASTQQPRTNRVKRPHTKSRRGCFNCKSRRIKCQETKPACANCIHKDLDCAYRTQGDRERGLVVGDQRQPQTQSQSQSPKTAQSSSPGLSASPRISATPFTGDDLRFWHHFLVDARPHLPFGDEETWLSEIPALAHDCPYLLHAMLSLGASHCSLITPRGYQYTAVAIAHRGKALKALGTILAKGDNCTVLEMDGALATCYTLTFQAHHMSDGVVDFAVMVRGCGLVTDWYFQQSRESKIFNLRSQETMVQLITSWLPWEPQSLNDQGTIATCIAALDRLQPLLQTPEHHAFYDGLRLGYESLLISCRHAFMRLTSIYASWARMDNVEFLTFIAPGNHVSRALFIHYITFDAFMRPVYMELARERNLKYSGGHFLIYRWAETVYQGLPESMQELVHDQFQHLGLYLIPEIEFLRETFPQWKYELIGFIAWLRKRVPSEMLELYNI